MEITVIDDSDVVGSGAAATRVGEVYMTDVVSMITNVLRVVGTSGRIDRLNVLDHGNAGGIEIGEDWIDTSTFGSFQQCFLLLRHRFASRGFVHFQHCDVGSNHELLTRFSRTFEVPVYAGTGAHNPIYRFNFGDYVVCNPGGTCFTGVGRP